MTEAVITPANDPDSPSADELVAFFALDEAPCVPVDSYYDILAQMIKNKTRNWVAFGVGWNRTFQELNRVRNRYTHSNALFAFDWWEGLPEDWRPGYPQGTFRIPRERVINWYRHDDSVIFHEGLFADTITAAVVDQIGAPALIHIDCDLYASTKMVLERCPPVPGTLLLFDEFYSPAGEWDWTEHEARAFYEFCQHRQVKFRTLMRRDVAAGPLSEQVAFLVQDVD
ncbi:MAG: hypothetical protein O2971_06040 [Proteobacteria bacterium]|nr:hypothetical protein [Pseudomonadota bacterium]